MSNCVAAAIVAALESSQISQVANNLVTSAKTPSFQRLTLFLVISVSILTWKRKKWKRTQNNRVRNYVWPEG